MPDPPPESMALVPYRAVAVWRPPKPARWGAFTAWFWSYAPARWLLALSVLGVGYLIAGCVLLAPWPCAFAVIAYRVRRYHRAEPPTTHGSARWADAGEDLRGMIGSPAGLVVGQVSAPRPTAWEAVGGLFDPRVGADEACRRFARLLRRHQPPADVRLPRTGSVAIFSPPGGGKSTGIGIPFLLDCRDAVIVADMKGELYEASAAYRRLAFSHRIVRLDPFGTCAGPSDVLNVLDLIDPASPYALDQIRAMAEALVVRTGQEKERHWDDSAEIVIAAMIAAALVLVNPGMQSLQSVRLMLADPELMADAVRRMCESDAFDGMMARMGQQLAYYTGKEHASVMTTVGRHLRFLDTPGVASVTGGVSSFDPQELLYGRMTVYLVLPPEYMRSHSGLLRLWLGSLIQSVVRAGLQERNLVHVLVDEAAALKRLEVIDDALNRYRAYGIRLILMYQSIGQLKECWPDGADQTLLSGTTQVFMGVADYQTAELVSARTGEATVLAHSRGGSGGGSVQSSGQGPSGSYGRNWGWSDNVAPTGRRLLTPTEVLGLHPRISLTFCPSLPPIWAWLGRHYDPAPAPRRSRPAVALLGAGLLFALVAACGARLTGMVTAPLNPPATRRSAITGDRHAKPDHEILQGDQGRARPARNPRVGRGQ